jgi:regulator of sigma E protease
MGSNGKGFKNSVRYAFEKFYATLDQMAYTVGGLFTGKISINALSGPVGIFEVVDKKREQGFAEIIYLTAYLSINLGLMNILPIPALDGGHVLFVLIELITRKKVNAKVEGIATTIFFFLLMALMLYVTIHDIIRLIL